jgi:hypothetical protein
MIKSRLKGNPTKTAMIYFSLPEIIKYRMAFQAVEDAWVKASFQERRWAEVYDVTLPA